MHFAFGLVRYSLLCYSLGFLFSDIMNKDVLNFNKSPNSSGILYQQQIYQVP